MIMKEEPGGVPAWRKHSRDMRTALKVIGTCKPWTTSTPPQKLLGPGTPERFKECIDIAYIDRIAQMSQEEPAVKPADLAKGFFVDVSQGVQLKKWGEIGSLNRGFLRCACLHLYNYLVYNSTAQVHVRSTLWHWAQWC